MSTPSALDALQCPNCRSRLDVRRPVISCSACGRSYPRLGEIPILLREPDRYLSSCRTQLRQLADQVAEFVQDIHGHLSMLDVLSLTQRRCLAVIESVEGQLSDVQTILEPLLSASNAPERTDAGGAPATMQYLPYLYRDWGCNGAEANDENERSLAAVDEVLGGRPLGRTLVLGAGAGRLAYDLHHRTPESEFVLIDIDPLLFSAAQAITRGEVLSIREAILEIGQMDQASMEWHLKAPKGPVDSDRFHFILADGLEPPFPPNTFDTILTPWFIDQGPDDVRDLISTMHRLLRNDGCWLNIGPLAYEPDVPITLRFSKDELFDLAQRIGFRIDRSRTDSVPYLVSRLNGRGKVEWVLAFAATKVEDGSQPSGKTSMPDWLLFRHIPIPVFSGQSLFWSETPAIRMIVSSIDGSRNLDDIARLVAGGAGRSDLSESQIRQAVRQCLAQVHPECRSR